MPTFEITVPDDVAARTPRPEMFRMLAQTLGVHGRNVAAVVDDDGIPQVAVGENISEWGDRILVDAGHLAFHLCVHVAEDGYADSGHDAVESTILWMSECDRRYTFDSVDWEAVAFAWASGTGLLSTMKAMAAIIFGEM